MGFSNGFDGIDELAKQSELRRVYAPRRFRMKAGEEKQVSFLDGGVRFPEHTYSTGDFQSGDLEQHYVHCLGMANGCPFCFHPKMQAYHVTVFTVIDHTAWTGKDGKVVVDQKKVLAAREEQAVLLRDLSAMVNGLKGKRITVRRSNTRNSSAWGTAFSLALGADSKPLPTDWRRYDPATLAPFQYENLFAQKSKPEMDAIYQRALFSATAKAAMPANNQNWGQQTHGFQTPQQQWSAPAPQAWAPPQDGVKLEAPQTAANPADNMGADIPF